MKIIIKNMIESNLGRTLTAEEEKIIDEHTDIVSELYKLEKRRKELEKKLFDMKGTISIKLPE